MKLEISNIIPRADVYYLPFTTPTVRSLSISKDIDVAIDMVIEQQLFKGEKDSVYVITMPVEGKMVSVVMAGYGQVDSLNNRRLYLTTAAAYSRCKNLKQGTTAMLLDNVRAFTENEDYLRIMCTLPVLISSKAEVYKSKTPEDEIKKVYIVSTNESIEEYAHEANICAEGTLTARRLCNMRSNYQTPEDLAREAMSMGSLYGYNVEVFDKKYIEDMKMDSFLSVARGAESTPPVLIVMEYMNGGELPRTALIGKGIVYDSGGYNIKGPTMKTMYDDMGGAAAVIGAMNSIARMNLKVNVVGVIAACENKIGPDAMMPGDIINSMSGKTIEILNTDAEGRLTLADAVTYAIREKGCEIILDIATLTGAAKNAVGRHCAPVLSNDDMLWSMLWKASQGAAEKVWRLDEDEEMRTELNSSSADLRNSNPGGTAGGGTIVAGLFIKEFVENKPWVHVDMAPVNMRIEGTTYSPSGATGYGAALLYYFAKQLQFYHKKNMEEVI